MWFHIDLAHLVETSSRIQGKGNVKSGKGEQTIVAASSSDDECFSLISVLNQFL